MIITIPVAFLSKSIPREIFLWIIGKYFLHFDLKRVAKVLSMSLDVDQGLLKCSLDLKGESNPLVVEELRYKIVSRDKMDFLEIISIKTDREWINAICELQQGKQYGPLDKAVVKMISMIK